MDVPNKVRAIDSTAKISALFPCVFIAYILTIALPLQAQMTEISDRDLSRVSAQAGISFNTQQSGVRITTGSYKFSDTDSSPRNWVEFNNVSISGPGGWFSMDTPEISAMDIATDTNVDGTTRTFTNFYMTQMMTPRTYSVGNFVFCNQDLGSLLIDSSTLGPATIRFSGHPGTGTSGIEYEFISQWSMKDIYYNYNSVGGALHLQGITLAGTVSGADNPSDPSTWELSGGFRIGDLFGGVIDNDDDGTNPDVPNPATFDVGTDPSTNSTKAFMNIPMKGTVRVADVNFGGTGFGPCAIDNITVHHLFLTVSGD